jgi:4-hydroxy-3-polyprenylbenzoate decarboxylase
MSAIQRAAIAWNILRNAGISGIQDVYIHPVNNGTTVIVQIKKLYEGQPKQIASALWGSNASTFRYKIVIVVDEDIDPSDYEAVDWAINYRVDPGSDDLVIFRGTLGSALDPSTPLENRRLSELGAGLWNRLLIDATRTWRFPRRPEWNNEKFPPVSRNRPEDIEQVRKRWADYGFTKWKVPF